MTAQGFRFLFAARGGGLGFSWLGSWGLVFRSLGLGGVQGRVCGVGFRGFVLFRA